MGTQTTTAQIYVGTYGKYNSGSIAGEWLDLSNYSDISEFYAACNELHSDEPDPEFMFQDYEGIPECFVSESHLSEKYFEYRDAVSDLSENDLEAFNIWLANNHTDLTKEDVSDLISSFQDDYQGYQDGFNPQLDFAEQLFDECYLHDVPESIQYYIDYQKFANDLFMGDYWETDGHVFRSN